MALCLGEAVDNNYSAISVPVSVTLLPPSVMLISLGIDTKKMKGTKAKNFGIGGVKKLVGQWIGDFN